MEETISSKIEITPSIEKVIKKKKVKLKQKGRSNSLRAYRSNIKEVSKLIFKYAIKLNPDNLLSVKMSVMEAMRLVERKMKDNE